MTEKKIWAILCDTKFKSYILTYLVEKYQKWDRNINIFLAVASSTSIAAWAVWKINPLIWATIIAASQILTVIKPYLPYFKLVKELNTKLTRIEGLNIEIERLWYKLQNGKITDDVAAESYFDLKKQLSETLNFSDETIFSVSKKMMGKANERMKTYLKTHYDCEINIT